VNRQVAHRLFARQFVAAVFGVVCLNSVATAIEAPMGYASLNGGTTGGGNAATVVATTSLEFQTFATSPNPLNILVDGALNVGSVQVASNKTIVGMGSTSELVGSLRLTGVNNVIVRNLSLSNPLGVGEGDAVTLRLSTNIWFDHNNIFNTTDGLLDIVQESDFVTVSWNKFFYTMDYATNVNTGHRFAMLIGNSDTAIADADNLRVTLHNNHWGANVRERMPRVRFGDVHVFNEYFNSPGNNYVVRSAIEAQVLVENSYFENIDDPFVKQDNGLLEERNNLFVNTTGVTQAGDNVFDPPYSYFLHEAADVKDLVLGYAGVGRLGDFDGNGERNGLDFLQWQRGESPLPLSASDLADWEETYATAAPLSATTTAVPESSALLLGLVALLSSVTSRRRS
jgi:pectate lyase